MTISEPQAEDDERYRDEPGRPKPFQVTHTDSYAFLAVNRDWKIVFADFHVGAPLYRARNELIGQDLWMAFPDLIGTPFEAAYRGAMTSGEAVEVEGVYSPFGRWLRVIVSPSAEGLALYVMALDERRMSAARSERERQRLHDLIMQAPAAIAVLRGPTHIYELTNHRFAQLVGRSDLIGKPGREAIPELMSQGIWDLLDRVYQTGEPLFGNEFPVWLDRSGDGTLDQGYFNAVAQPITTPEGDIEGIFIHAVEVTDQVRARERLEALASEFARQRERLELAQKVAHIGTFEWDIVRDHIVWTPELEALYGLPPGSFEGTFANWRKRVHPDDVAQAEASAWEAARGGPPYHAEFRVIRPDGAVRWLLGMGETSAEAGTPTRMIGVNIDITDRKLADEDRQQFSAMIAHELRNPLASLLGYAQLLQRRQQYDARALETIITQAKRLERLTRDLRETVRLESGTLSLARGPVDVRALILAVVEQVQATTNAHILRVSLPDQLPIAEWDADRVTQVLGNLLLNAVKYTPLGGMIRITAVNEGSAVRIAVTDSGIGIPPEALPHIFEPFYRATNARDSSMRGMGLGLPISKALADAHGGQLTVQSRVGEGSTFTLLLPYHPLAPAGRASAAAAGL